MATAESGFDIETFNLVWAVIWLVTAAIVVVNVQVRQLSGPSKSNLNLAAFACILNAIDSAILFTSGNSSCNSQLTFAGSFIVGIVLSSVVENWCEAAEIINPRQTDIMKGLLVFIRYGYKAVLFHMPLLTLRVSRSIEIVPYGPNIMKLSMWAFMATSCLMLAFSLAMWYVLLFSGLFKSSNSKGVLVVSTINSMSDLWVLAFAYYNIRLHDSWEKSGGTFEKGLGTAHAVHAWFSYLIYWAVTIQLVMLCSGVGSEDPLFMRKDRANTKDTEKNGDQQINPFAFNPAMMAQVAAMQSMQATQIAHSSAGHPGPFPPLLTIAPIHQTPVNSSFADTSHISLGDSSSTSSKARTRSSSNENAHTSSRDRAQNSSKDHDHISTKGHGVSRSMDTAVSACTYFEESEHLSRNLRGSIGSAEDVQKKDAACIYSSSGAELHHRNDRADRSRPAAKSWIKPHEGESFGECLTYDKPTVVFEVST